MKQFNDYQRVIADTLGPLHLDLNRRTLIILLACLLALLPAAAFCLIQYPLPTTFILLLGATILAMNRS